jgi:hypothetical protein
MLAYVVKAIHIYSIMPMPTPNANFMVSQPHVNRSEQRLGRNWIVPTKLNIA